jgi:hypothetical protein
VGRRSLVVRRYGSSDDVSGCHILYLGGASSADADAVVVRLGGTSTLTVGENEGQQRVAGMIQFVTNSNRLRLRIDVAAARSAGLTISSKLLRQAEIVGGEGRSRDGE